jgi:hypothetical protein
MDRRKEILQVYVEHPPLAQMSSPVRKDAPSLHESMNAGLWFIDEMEYAVELGLQNRQGRWRSRYGTIPAGALLDQESTIFLPILSEIQNPD